MTSMIMRWLGAGVLVPGLIAGWVFAPPRWFHSPDQAMKICEHHYAFWMDTYPEDIEKAWQQFDLTRRWDKEFGLEKPTCDYGCPTDILQQKLSRRDPDHFEVGWEACYEVQRKAADVQTKKINEYARDSARDAANQQRRARALVESYAK